MQRPPNLTDEEWADYRQCQADEDSVLAQVADHEAQMETGLIDSYEEYEFNGEPPSRSNPEPYAPAGPALATGRHRSTPASGPLPGLPPGQPRTPPRPLR
ncbi:hypothetical protein AQI95_29180 [Streptomyces yokosukanensis]|uniref:Uncharacterized protein n=1 Tax=Streptomyces yokosukanensis TaxID=67386 RepID=A0A101NZG6_9ACTN|nr:hypothetical protein [Streptomyces yokosukanensis]KUN02145.1 hypothetical protein AQI95_29180 [Streptomyces yokosukanensis]